MGVVLPFPIVRRRSYLRKQVRFIASYRDDVAAKYFREAVRVQRQTMESRGIAPDLVDAEMSSLECALRAGIIRMQMTEGGAA